MPKKRNTSAPAASPAIAGDAATKSAERTKRTRSSKRNRSKLASPAAINNALALAIGDSTTIDASPSSARAAKSSGSAAAASASSPAPTAAAGAAPAAAIDARPVYIALPPRIRIGDAMRRTGLDEYKVARTFAGVVDKLSDGKNPKDTGGVQKLLVDVLKECSRHLDPPQTERAASAAPVHITMVHNVPRPVRTPTPPQQLNAASLIDAAAPSATPATEAAPASEPAASPASPPSSAPADPGSQ